METTDTKYSGATQTHTKPGPMNKDRMDDLASLFLPDLLNPLAAGQDASVKREDEFMYQDRRSNISTPSSTGLGLIMLYGEGQGDITAGTSAEAASGAPDFGAANSNYPPQYGHAIPGQYGNGQFPYGGPMGHYGTAPSARQFQEQNVGHSLRYADFVPAEAGFQQPMRHHLRQHLIPQPSYSEVIGQFDNMLWVSPGDLNSAVGPNQALTPGAPMHMGPGGPDYAFGGGFMLHGDLLRPGSANHVKVDNMVGPKAKPKPKGKPETNGSKKKSTASGKMDIKVDYSSNALVQLLDMTHTTDSSNRPQVLASTRDIPVNLRSFLHARMLTNDQDNFNYVLVKSGEVDPTKTYQPLVISCYRRNYINMYFSFSVDNPSGEQLYVAGEPIQSFSLEVSAIAEGNDLRLVPFLIALDKDPKANKEMTRTGDNLPIKIIDLVHRIGLHEAPADNYFMIKKLQFKSATANSTNLMYQTYNRLVVKLKAHTTSGDHILDELTSTPIIVRGRNPSFYRERNDILIKPRAPYFKASYTDVNSGGLETLDSVSFIRPSKSSEDDSAKEEILEKEEDSEDAEDVNSDSKEETNSQVDNDDSDEQDDEEEQKTAEAPLNAANLKEFIASMSENENYHYFPILNVYYLPPINVVYFPHGAHQAIPEKQETQTEGESKASTPSTLGATKRGSKVYFR